MSLPCTYFWRQRASLGIECQIVSQGISSLIDSCVRLRSSRSRTHRQAKFLSGARNVRQSPQFTKESKFVGGTTPVLPARSLLLVRCSIPSVPPHSSKVVLLYLQYFRSSDIGIGRLLSVGTCDDGSRSLLPTPRRPGRRRATPRGENCSTYLGFKLGSGLRS